MASISNTDSPGDEPRAAMGHEDRENITQRNQRESVFLRLPVEIRNTIYEHASRDERLLIRPKVKYGPFYGRQPSYQGSFSLLASCRQIRHEASSILLRLSIFDLTAFTGFTEALRRIPLDAADKIEKIVLRVGEVYVIVTWFMTEDLITLSEREWGFYDDTHSGLPSLQQVYLHSKGPLKYWGHESITQALKKFFRKKDLEIIIDWLDVAS